MAMFTATSLEAGLGRGGLTAHNRIDRDMLQLSLSNANRCAQDRTPLMNYKVGNM